jgi:predicted TIM-barrel fold metal-dependent hydrolase
VRDGYKVFDADAHVIYPADLWPRFLDKKYVDRVGRKQPFNDFETYNPTVVDGRWTQHRNILYGQFQKFITWTAEDMRAKYGPVLSEGFTGDRVAEALAVDGIDMAVIYGPEYDCWFHGIDAEMQAAMVRAYNRWGHEMLESSGKRVHVAAPVPLLDVNRAVEEIQYAYDHLGARAFWARPNTFNDKNLGDRYYDPIWELIQDLGVTFATHEFMGLRGTSYGHDRFASFTEWHSVVHTFEAMGAMLSMIVQGVYERFPRLRVAYLEAGCGWLPSWLHRIDEQLEMAALEFPDLTMSATEYFRRNCFISTECEDPFVADVIRWFGNDQIVYESDFPHPDSKYPHTVEHFLGIDDTLVSPESKRKILWDNALDFYRLEPADMPAALAGDASAAGVV